MFAPLIVTLPGLTFQLLMKEPRFDDFQHFVPAPSNVKGAVMVASTGLQAPGTVPVAVAVGRAVEVAGAVSVAVGRVVEVAVAVPAVVAVAVDVGRGVAVALAVAVAV